MTITDVGDKPQAGSAACNLTSGACVLCDDANWHCGDTTLAQCAYSPPRDACPSPTAASPCLACENGNGLQWTCEPTSIGLNPPLGWVQSAGPSCTP